MNATQLLHNLGQSLWLDNITRDLLNTGTLRRYISEWAVTGLTSNPTIFDHALQHGAAYDAAIREKLTPSLRELLADRGVVGRAVLEGVVEDRRIRGQAGHGPFADVAPQRSCIQQVTGDIVEPEALAQVVKQLGGVHRGSDWVSLPLPHDFASFQRNR